jgi:hypothetical protein
MLKIRGMAEVPWSGALAEQTERTPTYAWFWHHAVASTLLHHPLRCDACVNATAAAAAIALYRDVVTLQRIRRRRKRIS